LGYTAIHVFELQFLQLDVIRFVFPTGDNVYAVSKYDCIAIAVSISSSKFGFDERKHSLE
jgi:hypothetical protein